MMTPSETNPCPICGASKGDERLHCDVCELPIGQIHACCDAHELYWEGAHLATSLESVPTEEIAAMLPELSGARPQIAIAILAEGE